MSALTQYIASNDARMARMEAILVSLAGGQAPTTPAPVVEAPVAAPAPVQAAPVQALPTGDFPAGSCQGCGKVGMVSNTHCKACRRAAEKAGAPVVQTATKTVPAAQVSTKASAKGKGNPHHCKGERCNKFVAAGMDFCGIDCAHGHKPVVQAAAPVSTSVDTFTQKVLALKATGQFSAAEIAQILANQA